MIKIVTFFLAFAMAIEHLINIEIEQWQISFVSGTSFGLLISYWFLQKDLRQSINQEIDQFFSDLKWVEYLHVNMFLNIYHELEWFERDIMTYMDHLKYQEYVSNPDNHFDRTKAINFDIINNRCRGDCLIKPIKEHQTICKNDFLNFPEKDKDKIVSAALGKTRVDIWIRRELVIKHFKKNYMDKLNSEETTQGLNDHKEGEKRKKGENVHELVEWN